MFRAAPLLVLLAAAPLLGQPAEWIHLEVVDSDDPTRVRMTLPVSAVVRALPHVPEVQLERCELSVGRGHVSARDLRALLADLRAAGEGATVERDAPGHRLEGTDEGDTIRIRIESRWDGDDVEIRLPEAFAGALASGRRVALADTVRAVAAAGGGELALVTGDDTRVRVWVDRSPRQEE